MLFKNYKLNKVSKFFDKSFVDKLNKKIKIELSFLKKDYPNINIEKSLTKQTLFSRALSYRVFDDQFKNFLEKKINIFLSKSIGKKVKRKFILNPMIYIRFCRPNETLIKNYSKAKYYTEPHYDKSFENINFFSLWMPLEQTNYQTGSLCYFKIPPTLRKKRFPIKGKNKYSMHNYFKNPTSPDKMLSKYCKPVYTNKGDILFFNKYCLHGATKPINEKRLSINFQLFDSKVLMAKNNFQKNKFLLCRYSLEVCNLLNLLIIGELSGAKRVLNKISKNKIKKNYNFFNKNLNHKIIEFVSKFENRNNLNFKKNYQYDLHYSKELSILNNEI